jgi:hypothetical protein
MSWHLQQDRYRRAGSIGDLQKAIAIHQFQAAVNIAPKDHPYRAKYLNNLGNGFRYRYEETGAIDDLQKAIGQFQAAVDATPEDHPDRATSPLPHHISSDLEALMPGC